MWAAVGAAAVNGRQPFSRTVVVTVIPAPVRRDCVLAGTACGQGRDGGGDTVGVGDGRRRVEAGRAGTAGSKYDFNAREPVAVAIPEGRRHGDRAPAVDDRRATCYRGRCRHSPGMQGRGWSRECHGQRNNAQQPKDRHDPSSQDAKASKKDTISAFNVAYRGSNPRGTLRGYPSGPPSQPREASRSDLVKAPYRVWWGA